MNVKMKTYIWWNIHSLFMMQEINSLEIFKVLVHVCQYSSGPANVNQSIADSTAAYISALKTSRSMPFRWREISVVRFYDSYIKYLPLHRRLLKNARALNGLRICNATFYNCDSRKWQGMVASHRVTPPIFRGARPSAKVRQQLRRVAMALSHTFFIFISLPIFMLLYWSQGVLYVYVRCCPPKTTYIDSLVYKVIVPFSLAL